MGPDQSLADYLVDLPVSAGSACHRDLDEIVLKYVLMAVITFRSMGLAFALQIEKLSRFLCIMLKDEPILNPISRD